MNETAKPTYFSFLLCDHGEIVNLYFNGMPLGTIKAGVFHPHEFTTPDGGKRTITINDLPEPCRFKDWAELAEHVVVATVRLGVALTPKEDRKIPRENLSCPGLSDIEPDEPT